MKTQDMGLELFAMRWLRFEKKCDLVLCERSPRAWSCGKPDVLGITKARYMIEIEIKRTVSDFRADAHKPHRQSRAGFIQKQPKQFYYLVPVALVSKVGPILPCWAGLMQCGYESPNCGIQVLKPAPVNEDSVRLSVKECCRLLRMLSNFSISTAETAHFMFNRWRDGDWPCPHPEYEI